MGDSVHTFTTPDGIFELTIKTEFLKIADPAKHTLHKLMTEHKMGKYLHNPYGPAIRNIPSGYCEYWLEGKKVSDEVAEKIKHTASFNNQLEDYLK